jgi:hypothetical protein
MRDFLAIELAHQRAGARSVLHRYRLDRTEPHRRQRAAERARDEEPLGQEGPFEGRSQTMDERESLDTLLAERAIEHALVRYARGVDRCDEGLIASAYHEDSYDEHGEFRGTGTEFATWVVGLLSRVFGATSHQMTNVTIELDGDAAKVESYVVAYHKTRAQEGANAQLVVVGGRYLDEFAQRSGEWKIARRVVVVDWSKMSEIAQDFPSEGYTAGARYPDDPSYRGFFE